MNQAKVWILRNASGEHLALEKDKQFTFFGSHTIYSHEVLEKSFELVSWLYYDMVEKFIEENGLSGNYK